jgi:hypothetical protein
MGLVRWLVVLALAGCSAGTVVRAREPNCTRSYAAPIVDTVVAAIATTTVVVVARADGEEGDLGLSKYFQLAIGVPSLLAAIGFTASAVYGYTHVTRCRS